MKVPKEITENHTAYFIGDVKIKYRGNRKDDIISKRDFYDITIYSSEVFNTASVKEYNYSLLNEEYITIDLADVLIEKPDNQEELFQEDLTEVKIYHYSNRSFISDHVNYGLIEGKILFSISYTTSKTIMVDVPEKAPVKPEPKTEEFINPSPKKQPDFTKNSIIKSPPQEPLNVRGCFFNILALIIALITLIITLFLFIKFWKATLIFALIVGFLWLFSYFGKYILKLIRFLFIGLIAVSLISIIYALLSRDTHRPRPIVDDSELIVEDDYVPVWETEEEIVETDTSKQDTVKTVDQSIIKTLAWRDYKNIFHSFKYKVSKKAYNEAKYNRANYISYNNNWGPIYYNLYQNDYKYLDGFIAKYDSLKEGLSRNEFAELIVSSIQYQPYVWILDVSCNHQNYKYKIRQSGCSCLGYITRYAVQSPYEYISNQKGDCDTRSLLLYTILKHYKYDVVLLTSDYYQHAIIGINLPSYGKYKLYRGKKYYVWETTAEGMRIGQINASVSNMNLWKVTL
jgi:hypothetical protein